MRKMLDEMWGMMQWVCSTQSIGKVKRISKTPNGLWRNRNRNQSDKEMRKGKGKCSYFLVSLGVVSLRTLMGGQIVQCVLQAVRRSNVECRTVEC